MEDLPFGIVVRALDPERMGVTVPPLMESLRLAGVPPGATSVICEPLASAARHADLPRWIVYLHDAMAVGGGFVRKAFDLYRLLSEAPASARVGCARLTDAVSVGLYDTAWLKTLEPTTPDDAIPGGKACGDHESARVLKGGFQYAEDEAPLSIEWYPSLDVYRFVGADGGGDGGGADP